MADEFLLPYKGLYIRIINGMYYAFDDPAKQQPNDAVLGCMFALNDVKRKITLMQKGAYWNNKPTKSSRK